VLQAVDTVIAIGADPDDTLREFADSAGIAAPARTGRRLEPGEGLFWRVHDGGAPAWFRSVPPRQQLQRHLRKYAEGRLGEDRSFWFRGPDERLRLRAANLVSFVEIGNGVDDETWLHHLRQGDYSRWIADCVKDEALAAEIAAIEAERDLAAGESRARIAAAIEKRYTLPA